MGLKGLFKKKAEEPDKSEYVGVRRNWDGTFTPQRITPKVYGIVSKGGLRSRISRVKAAFKLSPEPFDGSDRIEWTLDGGNVGYVEGVVISPDAPPVISDVLHDFMAIGSMEHGYEVMRLKDPVLAAYLSTEKAYRLCGEADGYSYFEVDVKIFDATVEEALQIALDAHRGQKDLDGRPAVLHPIAVGLMGCNDAETKTGFLHDVVEDSHLTLEDLRQKGVDENVVAALELLTHRDEENYFEYVRRIAESGNITAIHVKINDLRHNLERGLKTYARAEEEGDTAMAERLARINDKHRKALQIFGCLPSVRALIH